MMLPKLGRAVYVIIIAIALAAVQEAGAKQSIDERRLAEFDLVFERTGRITDCINTRLIRDSRIINKQHILFRLSHGEFVLNKLPRTCWSLRPHRAFAYKTTAMRLCSIDTITVLDPVGGSAWRARIGAHGQRARLPLGPGCGLGTFEVVTPRDG